MLLGFSGCVGHRNVRVQHGNGIDVCYGHAALVRADK
jgi:hypothetical protein